MSFETPLVEVVNLTKTYSGSRTWFGRRPTGWVRSGTVLPSGKREEIHSPIVHAVEAVSFRIERGRTLALVGESGCGKTTVARLVAGILKPTRGTVHVAGIDVGRPGKHGASALARSRQMVFQDPYSSLNPRWRVRSIVAEPIKALAQRPNTQDIDREVDCLLEQVGLRAVDGKRYPHEFSGGQRQRIAIARALAGRPSFLICDEPTSALDVSVQAQILNLLKELQARHGLTMLFISHDLAVVSHMADEIGVLCDGRLCELGATDTILTQPRHAYTRTLLKSVPDLSRRRRSSDNSAKFAVQTGDRGRNPIERSDDC